MTYLERLVYFLRIEDKMVMEFSFININMQKNKSYKSLEWRVVT